MRTTSRCALSFQAGRVDYELLNRCLASPSSLGTHQLLAVGFVTERQTAAREAALAFNLWGHVYGLLDTPAGAGLRERLWQWLCKVRPSIVYSEVEIGNGVHVCLRIDMRAESDRRARSKTLTISPSPRPCWPNCLWRRSLPRHPPRHVEQQRTHSRLL